MGDELVNGRNLRDLLRFGDQSYRVHFGEGGKGLEGRTEMNSVVLKYVAVLLASAAFFVGGYQYAAALYGADIAELREDYATRAQALEAKYREKERTYAQSLVEAWEVRDAALARASDLSGDLDRVRLEADAARRRLSGAGPDSCKSCREQLARCSGIVVRGAELVKRGVELSERAAIDKDAVVKMSSR